MHILWLCAEIIFFFWVCSELCTVSRQAGRNYAAATVINSAVHHEHSLASLTHTPQLWGILHNYPKESRIPEVKRYKQETRMLGRIVSRFCSHTRNFLGGGKQKKARIWKVLKMARNIQKWQKKYIQKGKKLGVKKKQFWISFQHWKLLKSRSCPAIMFRRGGGGGWRTETWPTEKYRGVMTW